MPPGGVATTGLVTGYKHSWAVDLTLPEVVFVLGAILGTFDKLSSKERLSD